MAAKSAKRTGSKKRGSRPAEQPARGGDVRTRWLLVREAVPGFTLYYDVSEGLFAMNEPGRATLFRRREHAIAVRSFLGENIVVVRCRTDARGELVVTSLPERCARRR